MNIYVGNLSYGIKEENLEELFSPFGAVSSVRVIRDQQTGRSKGFGFVEMNSDEEGENAVNSLNGKDIDGRKIVVNPARPREERPPRRGGGGGGGGYGGGGGGQRRGGGGGGSRYDR